MVFETSTIWKVDQIYIEVLICTWFWKRMEKIRWTNRVRNEALHSVKEESLNDHPFYLVCPDVFSLVGELLSGDGCGSPNHI